MNAALQPIPARVLFAFLLLTLGCVLMRPASASRVLDVTYTGGSVVSGPVSFGLGALPASVHANFHVGPGRESSEPPIREYVTADVRTADLAFGDGAWSLAQLDNFFMKTINGVVTQLVYGFNPITTPSVADGPILNFPLTITGTDIASGDSFEYRYANSTQSLRIPEPGTLVLLGLGLFAMARRRVRAA